jgi:hypothetical protein
MAKKGTDHGSDTGDNSLFYKRLEASLKKLVKSINRLGYTRNPRAMSTAAEHCHAVEHQLRQLDEQGANNVAVDDWLAVEAHQMLAEARRLLQAPLQPSSTEGNVITLKPDYKDLTDAAFERMLASSDIPRLLSSPMPQCDELVEEQLHCVVDTKKPATLRLVYSRDD